MAQRGKKLNPHANSPAAVKMNEINPKYENTRNELSSSILTEKEHTSQLSIVVGIYLSIFLYSKGSESGKYVYIFFINYTLCNNPGF
jgi:hypothetical protein